MKFSRPTILEDGEPEAIPEEYLEVLNAREMPVVELCAEGTKDKPQSEEAADANAQADPQAQLEKLRKTVFRQPPHREILYRTLVFAQSMRTLNRLENYIASLPEFKGALQPQYFLIQYLVHAGGLQEFELDDQGNIVTEEMKAGLDEDAIDDLVATWGYLTTDIGCELVGQMQPEARMASLLDEHPRWTEALLDTLSYLAEKRKVGELNLFLGSIPADTTDDTSFQPSAFVDRLEKSGVIAWDGGWQTTVEGMRFLETRRGFL